MKDSSEKPSEDEIKRRELRLELLKMILNNEGRRRTEAQTCTVAAGQ